MPTSTNQPALEQLQTLLRSVTVPELRQAAQLWGWMVKGTAKADIIQYLVEHLANPTEMAAAFRTLSAVQQQITIWLAHLGRMDDQGEMLRTVVGMAEGRDLPKATVTRAVGELRQRLIVISDPYQGTLVPETYLDWLPLSDAPGLLYRGQPADVSRLTGADALDQYVEHLLALIEAERPLAQKPAPGAPRSPVRQPPVAAPPPTVIVPHAGIVSETLLTRWGYKKPDEQNLVRTLLTTMLAGDLCRAQEQGGETRLVPNAVGVVAWRDLSPDARQANLRLWWKRGWPSTPPTPLQSQLTWDELDLVLTSRFDYSLRQGVEWLGREQLDIQVRHLRSWFTSLIGALKEDVWYSIARLFDLIYHLRRDLLFWTSYYIGWNWYDGETRLDAAQLNQRIWAETYGALIETWLVGPASWMGIIQAASEGGRIVAFRRLGRAASAPVTQLSADTLRFLSDDRLILRNTWQTGDLRQMLRQIAAEMGRDRETTTYVLDPAAFRQTLRGGQTAEQITQAFADAGFDLPNSHRSKLQAWQARMGQHQLYDNLGVIEFSDDVTLSEVQATTGLGRADLYPISPRCLVVLRSEAIPGLLEELRRKGYTPQVLS